MNKKIQYKRAVGLEHTGEAVPKVTTQGELFNADLIVKLAKRYNVPVIDNAQLAQSLSALDAGQEIPEHLYEAVAALLHELGQAKDNKA